MMPTMSGSIRFASRRTSTPLIPGILMSEIRTSTGSRSISATAAWPSSASCTWWPSRRSTIRSSSRIDRSSSTTRMRPQRLLEWPPESRSWSSRSCRDRRARREAHLHRRARPGLRCHVDLAAVVVHDAVDDRHARGRCPFRTRRGTAGRWPSSSASGMPTPSSCTTSIAGGVAGLAPRADAQPAAVGHGPQAVGRQVPDDLPHLALVGLAPDRQRGMSTSTTWSCAHLGAVAQQQGRVLQHGPRSSRAMPNRWGLA